MFYNTQDRIYTITNQYGPMTAPQITKMLKISMNTVDRELNTMHTDGRLQKTSYNRYQLTEGVQPS
jgi:Mn-dependent DtxR family transcriptional regulator